MRSIKVQDMKSKTRVDLLACAQEHEIQNVSTMRRHELVLAILEQLASREIDITAKGVIEVFPDGSGFLRAPEASGAVPFIRRSRSAREVRLIRAASSASVRRSPSSYGMIGRFAISAVLSDISCLLIDVGRIHASVRRAGHDRVSRDFVRRNSQIDQ
jgi:hypothetical protein